MSTYNLAAAALTAAVTAATASGVGNDWNGLLGTVDLAKPLDYTSDEGKICFDASNVYQLGNTLAYLAYVCADKPADDTAFQTAMGDGFTARYWPLAAEAIARYRIYRLFHLANLTPEFRAVDKAAWPAGSTEVVDLASRVGAEVYAIATGDIQAEVSIAGYGRHVLMSIVAVAMHRKQFEGHSWFTDAMSQASSPTMKICGIAGMGKQKFVAYMKARGHDGNHHLSDSCIHKFAMVIGQVSDAPVPDTVAKSVLYCNEQVTGRNLKELFYTGEATKNRYPPGVLGSGALITGMALMVAVVGDINMKVKVDGCSDLGGNIGELDRSIKAKALSHEKIIELSSDMGPSLAWVWGYAEAAKIAEESTYVSLAAHANRYQAMNAAGKACAKAMKRVTPHSKAMEAAIASAIASFAGAVAAAARVNVAPAGAPSMPLCSNLVKIDLSKITATVGVAAAGAPQVFYDAES